MRDAATDLILGGSCLACGRPGRSLCKACANDLTADPRRVIRSGLDVPAWAGGSYTGALRQLIPAHKDAQAFQLAKPLGALLAAAIARLRPTGEVVLVAVPSTPEASRQRGYDHTVALARVATTWLRPRLQVQGLLRVSNHTDQTELGAAARAANLHERMRATGRGKLVVLCDDVITTGASIMEATRALRAAGNFVWGAAVVAETPNPRDVVPG